jgi:hypothetical protein
MMPAATHFDPVVGVDIHMVQPSGPVPPTPIPHPYIGLVFDPFDYLPIIGSTVKINGMHRAIAGTTGKALPSHFPIGGTFVPPLPQNMHENFMGSSTVQMDHDAAAYMALPCLSCQSIGMPPPPRRSPKKKTKLRSLVLPTSIVLPIPKGAPVLIGGAPTISLFALAAHLVGPLAKAIRKAKAFRKAAAALKKARRRAFRNMKPGFLKCKVLRAEPVDVVTGEVVVDQQDFELPGRIPIAWTRHYRSGSMRKGVCGVGWETPADARLEPQADGVVFHDGTGVATYFDALPDAEPVMEPVDGGRLYIGCTATMRSSSRVGSPTISSCRPQPRPRSRSRRSSTAAATRCTSCGAGTACARSSRAQAGGSSARASRGCCARSSCTTRTSPSGAPSSGSPMTATTTSPRSMTRSITPTPSAGTTGIGWSATRTAPGCRSTTSTMPRAAAFTRGAMAGSTTTASSTTPSAGSRTSPTRSATPGRWSTTSGS